MEVAANCISPKSPIGSVSWSILVHGFIWGTAILLVNMHFMKKEAPPDFIDLGYESFDAPPVPAPEVKRVMKSPTTKTPADPKVVPDNIPKEMQDEKSDVAGTQKAQKVDSNIGSESNGNASATPYYKIKPKYPKAALVSGVEGWILFEIDINEQGEVENVRTLDGVQKNMFQTEARRAVELWKYRPFLDASGKPYRKLAHPVRVDFKLNEVASTGS